MSCWAKLLGVTLGLTSVIGSRLEAKYGKNPLAAWMDLVLTDSVRMKTLSQ